MYKNNIKTYSKVVIDFHPFQLFFARLQGFEQLEVGCLGLFVVEDVLGKLPNVSVHDEKILPPINLRKHQR
jgi:hypothetical protein